MDDVGDTISFRRSGNKANPSQSNTEAIYSGSCIMCWSNRRRRHRVDGRMNGWLVSLSSEFELSHFSVQWITVSVCCWAQTLPRVRPLSRAQFHVEWTGTWCWWQGVIVELCVGPVWRIHLHVHIRPFTYFRAEMGKTKALRHSQKLDKVEYCWLGNEKHL